MSEGVAAASTMVCAGCGATATEPRSVRLQPDPDPRGVRLEPDSGTGGEPYPFRCTHARQDDDIDHLMTRVLDTASIVFPRGDEPNPFVKFRQLFHSYHVARAHGLADADYVALVRNLDDQVARVDGRGFRFTPFTRSPALSERLGMTADGGVWVKDETGNVSGSHKARHLMGLMLHLQVIERVGLVSRPLPALAIASCGNAALAAAVVARAADRELLVFIPPDAPPAVVNRLERLGANLTVCPRDPGVLGDPCYLRFQEAVRNGALPFCCQGTANGLTIEGGETLGYEMLAADDVPRLDCVVIQVGGGALASAVIQSFTEALALGEVTRLPRFHAVQTRGAFPLKRAYDRLVERFSIRRSASLEASVARSADQPPPRLRRSAVALAKAEASRYAQTKTAPDAASGVAPDVASGAAPGVASGFSRTHTNAGHLSSSEVQRELRYAATHRSEFMWPWEEEPRSIAHGILDDETYDWLAIVKGMLTSGGGPIVVDERQLVEAHDLAREATGINVDHTGAAGLAGLLQLGRDGGVGPHENVAVIFSGVKRGV